MKIVALTGGIGAGKSTVAKMFTELGAHTIDADSLAREAVAPGSKGLQQVVSAFGGELLSAQGELDRAALGKLVFADQEAKRTLEAIVHPEVARLFRSRVEEIAKSQPAAIVIYQIPLLVETGAMENFDAVIVLRADPQVRATRLVETRGLTLAEAKARIGAQASEQARLAVADFVIDTDKSLALTRSQVAATWQALQDSAPIAQ